MKKQKQGIEFVKAQAEDMHGLDINQTHAYLKYDGSNHMVVMEGQVKNNGEGDKDIRFDEKLLMWEKIGRLAHHCVHQCSKSQISNFCQVEQE